MLSRTRVRKELRVEKKEHFGRGNVAVEKMIGEESPRERRVVELVI